MGKIKLYDIAKELDIPSKELVDLVNKLNINVKSHLSSVSEEQAETIKNEAKKIYSKTNNSKKEAKKSIDSKEKESTPVIIRREVIVEDEDKKAKEEAKNAE